MGGEGKGKRGDKVKERDAGREWEREGREKGDGRNEMNGKG